MSNLTAVERYTQSLFEVAEEHGLLEQVDRDLRQMADLFAGHPELEGFFASKNIAAKEKTAMIDDLAKEEGFTLFTGNFFKLLLENRRFGYDAPKTAARAFNNRYAKSLGIRKGRIVLARALDDEARKALEEKIGSRMGFPVRLEFEVDESLIGGSYLEIEGVVYEDNLRRRLSKLRDWMKG